MGTMTTVRKFPISRLSLLLCLFVILFPANSAGAGSSSPDSGSGTIGYQPATTEIKYSFYYYLPNSALKRNPVRVLLYGHGSPQLDTYNKMEEYVRTLEIPRLRSYCDTYRYVLLIMVTPRNYGSYPDYKMNTQAMVRWVMFNSSFDKPDYEFYKRPDIVFNKVIDNFMAILYSKGYTPYRRVFMTGFSNAGLQANRFPILYPDRIAATAIGAAGAYIYPVNDWNGTKLTYPVGTTDVTQISGNSFHLQHSNESLISFSWAKTTSTAATTQSPMMTTLTVGMPLLSILTLVRIRCYEHKTIQITLKQLACSLLSTFIQELGMITIAQC